MSQYTKKKYSFTLHGVKYNDISGYNRNDSPNNININVAGTAQMIRQWLKTWYPKMPVRNYYWVKSESYAGGNSIKVYFNNAPEEFYNKIKERLDSLFEEGKFNGMEDIYEYNKQPEKTKEGYIVDFGTKYLFVNNRKPYDAEETTVDWSFTGLESGQPMEENFQILQSTPKPKPKPTEGSSSRGIKIRECAGWEIFVKKVGNAYVINAVKKKDTPPNKEDWNVIKGDILVETAFKWGRFGAFEKWVNVEPKGDEDVLNKLCEILDKYYKSANQEQQPVEEWQQSEEQEQQQVAEEKPQVAKTKEQIEKAIKGLQYLADAGNEKAAKAIKGLQYLLNK